MSDPAWLVELRLLHDQRGHPSLRTMAKSTGLGSSTLGDTFSGKSFPALANLLKIVRALGGNEDKFRELWQIAVDSPVEGQPTVRELLQGILDELVLIRLRFDDPRN